MLKSFPVVWKETLYYEIFKENISISCTNRGLIYVNWLWKQKR